MIFQNCPKLCKTILKYHSWYLCQISRKNMLLPILIPDPYNNISKTRGSVGLFTSLFHSKSSAIPALDRISKNYNLFKVTTNHIATKQTKRKKERKKQGTECKYWKIDTERESALILTQIMRQPHICIVQYFVQGEATTIQFEPGTVHFRWVLNGPVLQSKIIFINVSVVLS